jgi:ComEC/Rec2-related protein
MMQLQTSGTNHFKVFTELVFKLFPGFRLWMRFPALIAWIAFSAGILTAVYLSPHSFLMQIELGRLQISVLVILAVSVFSRHLSVRFPAYFAAGFLCFTCAEMSQMHFSAALPENTGSDKTVLRLYGQIASVPILSNGRFKYVVTCDSIRCEKNDIFAKGKKFLCSSYKEPAAYGCFAASGSIRLPEKRKNPCAYEEYYQLTSSGIAGRFSVDSIFRSEPPAGFGDRTILHFRSSVLKAFRHIKSDRNRALFMAAFLGETNNIDSTTKDSFRKSGLYHLLSISGLHIAILTTAVFLALSLVPIPRGARTGLTLCVIWGYMAAIGFIPSLFRSVIMATVLLLSLHIQRRQRALNSLGAAGITWLYMSPASILTPGYQLSFAATAGIIALSPVIFKALSPKTDTAINNLVLKPLITTFSVSLSAFLATAPVMAWFFNSLSFFGLFANLFAVSLMSLCMNFMFAGIIFENIFASSGWIFMRIAELFLNGIVFLARLSDMVPWTGIRIQTPPIAVIVAFCTVLLMLSAVSSKKAGQVIFWIIPLLLLFVPVSLIARSMHRDTEITCFHLREGVCAGIRFPNGKTWILGEPLETGRVKTYRDAVNPWLKNQMSGIPDAIILPSVGINAVHGLAPVYNAKQAPGMLAGVDLRQDSAGREDFLEYIKETSANFVSIRQGGIFIPSARCTVSTLWMTSDAVTRPVGISVSVPGTGFLLWTGNKNHSRQYTTPGNSSAEIICFDGDAAVINGKTYDVRNNGAVIFNVTKNKISVREF